MTLNELLRAKPLPDFDIDAMFVGDAEEALGVTHHRADALVPRIGHPDAWRALNFRAWQAVYALRLLRVLETGCEAAVTHVFDSMRWFVFVGTRIRGGDSRRRDD